MQKRKITIHDISKALNINSSTVSRALNNSPKVSKETKARILTKAKELGYQRNSLASNLRTNKTNTIGVIVPRLSRNFFSNVIAGIEETAYENGYNVLICQSLESLEREKNIVNTLISNRVDGMLISISMETTTYEHLKAFKTHGAPIVFYDRPFNFNGASSVIIDDFKASFIATEHLILNGCKKIIHFSGTQIITLYKNRKKGYIAALEKHGIRYNSKLCYESKLSENDGFLIAEEVIKVKGVDGIYSANDTAAIGAMKYFKANGVKIPEDIAIVGFNNDPISAVIEPGLSSINQPDFEMGKIAAAVLIHQINDKKSKNSSKILDVELVTRASSKK